MRIMLANFQSQGREHEVIDLLNNAPSDGAIWTATGFGIWMGMLSGQDDVLFFQEQMMWAMSEAEHNRSSGQLVWKEEMVG